MFSTNHKNVNSFILTFSLFILVLGGYRYLWELNTLTSIKKEIIEVEINQVIYENIYVPHDILSKIDICILHKHTPNMDRSITTTTYNTIDDNYIITISPLKINYIDKNNNLYRFNLRQSLQKELDNICKNEIELKYDIFNPSITSMWKNL